jgi:sulfopyruvate decarboxylase subunit alpha
MPLVGNGFIPPDVIIKAFHDAHIDFIASLVQDDICDILRLLDKEPGIMHVHLSREEEGFGICAGAYLAGRNPAILIHNTGFLASGNALTSLNIANELPLLMVISYSGYFGEQNPWTASPGPSTETALNAFGVKYSILRDPSEASPIFVAAHQLVHASKRPVAVLLPPRAS